MGAVNPCRTHSVLYSSQPCDSPCPYEGLGTGAVIIANSGAVHGSVPIGNDPWSGSPVLWSVGIFEVLLQPCVLFLHSPPIEVHLCGVAGDKGKGKRREKGGGGEEGGRGGGGRGGGGGEEGGGEEEEGRRGREGGGREGGVGGKGKEER